jgi:hypothetical protein
MPNAFKSAKIAAIAGALSGLVIMWVGFQVVTNRHTGILRGAKQLLADASSALQAKSLQGLRASGSKHSVTLAWKASPSPRARYNVYRRDRSGLVTRLNPAPAAETGYIDNSVQPGQTYFYTTRAVSPSGTESSPSNEVRADVPSP